LAAVVEGLNTSPDSKATLIGILNDGADALEKVIEDRDTSGGTPRVGPADDIEATEVPVNGEIRSVVETALGTRK